MGYGFSIWLRVGPARAMMRLEYKYLVPVERLSELRAMIAPFVEADVYAAQRGLAGYTVRSIYFDTLALSFYQEKVAGLKVRRKLRLRGYNEYRRGDVVFLETKGKYGRMIVKGRAPVRYDQVQALLASGEVERYVLTGPAFPNALEDAQRFFFYLRRGALRPIILIVYEREAYQSRFNHALRITFDKNLRSALFPSLDALFQEDGHRYTMPSHLILEVKSCGGPPLWLREIIGTLGLKPLALSKYVLCLEAHRRPWVVTRRSMLVSSHPLVAFTC